MLFPRSRRFFLASVALASSCAASPSNPSFDLSRKDARQAIKAMEEAPATLPRPVVVVCGWIDPGFGGALLVPRLNKVSDDGQVISVAVTTSRSFDACRACLVAEIDKAFPSDDPTQTVEVDVIGVSMGGLVARHAAAPPAEGDKRRRLRVARLFTIGSPHRGAKLAKLSIGDGMEADMRVGSAFIKRLDTALAEEPYPIYSYVRLGDGTVGSANAAPHGQSAWWVDNPPLEPAHAGAIIDPRILADIFRRLRGEEPFTATPPAPLPSGSGQTPPKR